MAFWYIECGKDNDVVLSSRVRLARNIKDIPFSYMVNENGANKVVNLCKDAIINSNSTISKDFEFLTINSIGAVERQALMEQHLISPHMLNDGVGRGVMLGLDGHISIMINEEDHIRIQSIFGGFNLDSAWDLANKVDTLIEERIDYAFSEKYGYLTSCPTNTGTGLRVSVMLHLPGLSLTGIIGNMVTAVGKWGMVVRGLFGEGSSAQGDFYQLSNQITLGTSEADAIAKLREVAEVVITRERETRQKLKESGNVALYDKIHRSYGTLKHAYTLSTSEFLQLLSDVRLGVTWGIIKDVDFCTLNRLLVETGPANIIKAYGETSSQERDIRRAEMVRNTI